MSSFKKVIDTLDKAADGFGSIANQEQKKIYDEVIALAKDLDTDALGRVKQSIANLKRLTQIKAKLAALSKDKEWVAGISQFVKYFDVLQRQQNAYFSQQFGKKTLSESAQKKNDLMKQLSVQNTIEALMGDGLKANVTDKLNDILLRAVTTGAKYADLTEELRTHLMGKEGGQGAFARYATTYATTALSQYTGQQNKLLSEGLDTEWYVYEGSNKETTREFCEQLTKKRFIHKSEIPTILKGKIDDYQCAIYAKTGLPLGMIEGTTPENFQCNCGGWNCRHQLVPVADAVVPIALRNKFKQIRPTIAKKTTEEQKKKSSAAAAMQLLQKFNTSETLEKQKQQKELTQEEIKARQELTQKRRATIADIPQERKTNKLTGEQYYTKRIVCTKADIKNIIKHCKNDDEFKIALSIDKYLPTLSNGEREELIEKENTENKRKRGVKYYTKYTFTADDGNQYMLKCEAIARRKDTHITEHPYFLIKM